MIKSKKQMFIVVSVFTLVLMLGTVTYAFFNYTRTGAENVIRTGRIAFNMEQGTAINIDNVFPIDKSNLNTDTDNVGSVSIHITGDTTYSGGIEYLVSAVNVHNTVNDKTLPISIDVSYTASNNKDVGTLDASYFDNRGDSDSLYKVLAGNQISEGNKLLVGYIKPDATGIDGTITIKAYIDKDKVVISDTYPTATVYVVNDNMTENELELCVNKVKTKYSSQTDTVYENYCLGTGTISGYTFIQHLSNSYSYSSSDKEYFLNNNIISSYNNGTTNYWVDGRTVLTTSEWNSLQTNGVSFQIKVEANEGVWVPEQGNAMNIFPRDVFTYSVSSKVKEIYFNNMNSDEMHQRYEAAAIKADLTYNNEGEVLTWLEENNDDNTKYTMYVASEGKTFFTTGNFLFYEPGLQYADIVEFNNVDTSRVTDMRDMFYGIQAESMDLTSFNTSNVVEISDLFYNSRVKRINMQGLDLRKAQYMNNMFQGCYELLEVNLSGVQTRDVKQMKNLFYNADKIENINIEGFGGDNLDTFYGLVSSGSHVKNINMKNFNFGKVTALNTVLNGARELVTIDLSGIKMDSVISTGVLFNGCSSLTTVYVSDDWNADNVSNSGSMFYGCTSIVGGNGTTYDPDKTDKEYARIDGKDGLNGYLTLKTN